MKLKVLSSLRSKLQTIAKVQDWLDKRTGLKLIKLVNACGGRMFVEDRVEQLKIIFPQLVVDLKNPSTVVGLVLDKEKGWVLCTFKTNRDFNRAGVIRSIIAEIGVVDKARLVSTVTRTVRKGGVDQEAVMNFCNCANLMFKLTGDILDKAS